MQRQCIGNSPQMTGDNRNGSKFSHRSCRTQHNSIKQRPADMRKCNPREYFPFSCSHQRRRFLLLFPLCLQHRQKLPEYKRKCYKDCGKDYSRHSKDNLNIVSLQKSSHPSQVTKGQTKYQSGDHRRNRKRNIDQRCKKLSAPKIIF